MSLYTRIATMLGDLWFDRKLFAFWPWPAGIIGDPSRDFDWQDYRAFTRCLKPGDILIAQAERYWPCNLAISPSAFKHAAVYVGCVRGNYNRATKFIENPERVYRVPPEPLPMNIHPRACIHAIAEGVVCQDLGSVLWHADYVMAVRPWKANSERDAIIEAAFEQHGKPYDFDFQQSNQKALFCTELALYCIQRAAIVQPESIVKRVKLWEKPRKIVLADAYVKYAPVCCSESCLERDFQRQARDQDAVAIAVSQAWKARSR